MFTVAEEQPEQRKGEYNAFFVVVIITVLDPNPYFPLDRIRIQQQHQIQAKNINIDHQITCFLRLGTL